MIQVVLVSLNHISHGTTFTLGATLDLYVNNELGNSVHIRYSRLDKQNEMVRVLNSNYIYTRNFL
jgi:hypothetical protein